MVQALAGGTELNVEFFGQLHSSSEFCETLGRMTLAAGRFESDLRAYLRLRGVSVSDDATLGPLISQLQKHGMLSENGVQVLRLLKRQRNYLTHSLFDLLSYRINETMLPREGLVPEDASAYAEKAWELDQNLAGVTRLVEDAITRLSVAGAAPEFGDAHLFRP